MWFTKLIRSIITTTDQEKSQKNDYIPIYPTGIRLIARPTAITTLMLLSSQTY